MTGLDYKLVLVRLLPEIVLTVGALLVLFFDQFKARHWRDEKRARIGTALTIMFLLVAIFTVRSSAVGDFYNGVLVITPFTKLAQVLILILTIGAVSIGRAASFTKHIGEYFALIILAAIGLIILPATRELLTAFIALELTSLSLYLLTAFNKRRLASAEAGLKYFLFGSVATAFMLFGISLLFGLSGSTAFRDISGVVELHGLSPLMAVGIVLISVGFAFKLAAAPLHLWAPDAYQGAPAPVAALIASASKLASIVLFLNLFTVALPGQAGSAGFGSPRAGWTMMIAVFAAASMVFGNLVALAQMNLRRLIAYSAVAHAGYVLLSVLAPGSAGAAAGVYYLFTYGLSVIGIFGIIRMIEEHDGDLDISGLAGLSNRAPFLAICLFVFILSLAGIPPLAGFFGKFYLFIGALDGAGAESMPGLLWLVILAVGATTVSLYYYLIVLKHAFVVPSSGLAPLKVPRCQLLVLCFLAGAVVLLGCVPNLLIGPLQASLPHLLVP